MPELVTSRSHLNNLRKIFYRYKSNANILTNSPYYTNRQQNSQIISFIQANKHVPSNEQLNLITEKYEINAEIE